MPTSVLLVRWSGGWHEVVENNAVALLGRSEGFLSLGAVQSVGEVVRLTRAELTNQFARIREQLTAEHAPVAITDAPYLAYVPSNRITAEDFDGDPVVVQVQAMSVAADVNGELSFTPTLGDVIIGVDELQREMLLRHTSKETSGI